MLATRKAFILLLLLVGANAKWCDDSKCFSIDNDNDCCATADEFVGCSDLYERVVTNRKCHSAGQSGITFECCRGVTTAAIIAIVVGLVQPKPSSLKLIPSAFNLEPSTLNPQNP